MPVVNISGEAKLLRRTKQGRLHVLATGAEEFTLFRQDEQGRKGIAVVTATDQGATVKILDASVTVER